MSRSLRVKIAKSHKRSIEEMEVVLQKLNTKCAFMIHLTIVIRKRDDYGLTINE